MNKTHLTRFLIATLFLGLTACGGSGDSNPGSPPTPAPAPPPPPPPSGTLIGAAGGTVTGPSGTSVVIPAGALASDTRINIELITSGAPALPTGFTTTGGQMFAFTPHGTTFSAPVTVTMPFDPALVPAGQFPGFYKTNAQNLWEKIPNAVFDSTTVSAEVTSFSIFDVLNPPLFAGKPAYQWDIIELKGDALEEQVAVLGAGNSEGVAQHHDFGSAHRDAEVFSFDGSLLVPSDDKATAQIAGTADGSDWWVGNEAPLGIIGAPDDTIGMKTVFRQTQTFTKLENDATLSFYIINAFLQTSDANGVLDRGCPRGHGEDGEFCDAISAQLTFEAIAFTAPSEPSEEPEFFFTLSGSAQLTGIAGSWDSRASTDALSRHELWNIEDFTFDIDEIEGHEEALITMELAHPIFHEYFVDLSDIEVGQSFTLHFEASTTAYNRAASQVNSRGPEFETSARAYLRDPRRPLGVGIVAAGVEAIDTETPGALPPVVPLAPEPCVPGPGPDPAAGTIQFDAASYSQLESNVAPSITVTRTGGTLGAVTATFRTTDGSAIAGTDYAALAATVFFADGDSEPRVVTLDLIANTRDEPDRTVNLTLSEPGGCAALGSQTTAVLTIRDDDLPPPPASFTVGGTVTGLVGEGLTLRDHQFLTLTPGNGPFTFTLPTPSGSPYEVTITAQPSSPVQECTIANGSGIMGNANVTNIQVSCVTPSPPGGLDPGFGGGTGIVSTAFGGDETDMLLQPDDGKILMIGGSGTDFVLARYDIDGTLDESFGDGGLVTTDIAGSSDAAFGAALLNDGRIVVVGSARVGSNDDFAIVRYKRDGTLDETFSSDGKTTTNFFGGRDRAFAVAVFPDNSVVVVGEAFLVGGGGSDFAVARYDASGELDTGFGDDGMVNTDIERIEIAKNVVIESGGTILVSGTTTLGSSSALGHTSLVRYTAAGAPDASLNTTGTLSIPNLTLGEALAVQSDGRILVVGNAAVGGHPNFAVRRLEANGATDGSFGGGLATVGFTTQDDYGRDVAIDSEGRILVSGQASNLSNPNFAVARFTPNGTLDTSFSDDGKFIVDFFNASDSAENVAVQSDGKIVLGGFGTNGTSLRYGLARINP